MKGALAGRTAVLVDDGVATGWTCAAAASYTRRAGASHIVAAVPVGPPGLAERLAPVVDQVVVLRFDQAVTAFPDSIAVRSGEGRVLSDDAASGADARVVLVPVRSLPRGAYTVRWHVLSSDGHPISGLYTFGVRVAAPPPTEAFGVSGPTRTEDFVRWAYFLSLALVVGGLFAVVLASMSGEMWQLIAARGFAGRAAFWFAAAPASAWPPRRGSRPARRRSPRRSAR